MRKLSKETQEILENDLFMKKCCLCCCSPVEWHHNLILAGKQSDDPKHILPLCKNCHDKARQTETKEKIDFIMLTKMSLEEILKISKAINYFQRLKYLEKKYGKN